MPTLPVIEKATGRVLVVNFETYDKAQHTPVMPDVTVTPRHTKQEKDRAIAKEIHGRHQF